MINIFFFFHIYISFDCFCVNLCVNFTNNILFEDIFLKKRVVL